MKKLNELHIGVIGTGGRGLLAEYAHRADDGVFIVAGADINENELIKFQERFGKNVFVTRDYRRILEIKDIDVIFITTPDYLHEEHAIAALQAGKNVYLEKPMAITIDGCDRILNTAYTNKKKLYIGHNMRHMAFTQKIKDLIDAGNIGEVKTAWCRHFIAYGGDAYFKSWHAEQNKSTGLLLQKGAHDIDILHWLCGGFTQRVTAMGGLTLYDRIEDRLTDVEQGDSRWYFENWPPLSQKKLNPLINVEDISMMLMQLDNGVFASYQQCHFTPDGWRNYTIIGTEGRIENFGDFTGDCIIRLWNKRVHYNPKGDKEYYITAGNGTHGGGDFNIVNEFIRYIRNGDKIKISPIAARYSVAAGYQATQSIRNNSIPLDIPPLSKEIINYFNTDII